MRVFLTGGTGFVGSHIARCLLGGGHDVRCLVRQSSDTSRLKSMDVRLVKGDLADRASLLEGMKGCDWLVNAGAAYSFWAPDARTYREANVSGMRNIMEAAQDAGVAKVVHVSSVVVFGRTGPKPIDENTPAGGVWFSEYARTKHEGELVAWHLHETSGLPLVVVYPGAVLGPGDPKATGQYIQNLLHRRLPATILCNSSFPFVHVKDVAEAICRAAEKQGNIGAKYLLVAENLTFGQVNSMVAEISGVSLPFMSLPKALTFTTAAALTALSRVLRRPPLWGMSLDQIRTMANAPIVDGSKAERELGIRYTPIRRALQDEIESYGPDSRR